MKVLVLFFISMLTACGSPQNHKVMHDGSDEKSPSSKVSGRVHTLSNGEYSVEVKWLTGPFSLASKESKLMIFVRDSNENLTSISSEIGFYAWMPSMGHPMEAAGSFKEVSKGVYLNSHIKFNMGGEWEMFIQIYSEDYEIQNEAAWLEFL